MPRPHTLAARYQCSSIATGFTVAVLATIGCSGTNPYYDPGAQDGDSTITAAVDSSSDSTGTGPRPSPADVTSGPSASEDGTSSNPSGNADANAGSESDDGRDDDGQQNPGSTSTTGSGSETGREPFGRRMFVSSDSYTGNLGGLAGADATCQELADSAMLGGSWLAFIFDGSSGPDAFPQAGGPFVTLDGHIIAEDWADLLDGQIETPVDLTEQGMIVAGNVWTGLYEVGGALFDNFCDGWTAADGDCDGVLLECGAGGTAGATDNTWDGFYVFNCAQYFHLYCVENPV